MIFPYLILIHSQFITAKDGVISSNKDENRDSIPCWNEWTIMEAILEIIYVFLQLCVIFKFSNVIVNRHKRLARLAFMHCIATSLCSWIGAIIMETFTNEIDTFMKDAAALNGDSKF